MAGKHLKKEESKKNSAKNAPPKMTATTVEAPARWNQTTTSLPPEAIADPLLRKSLRVFGKLSPLQQAKLNVVDCNARIDSNRKSAAAFRKAASDPKCPEADAQKFRHEADILEVESFGLGFEQQQAFSDVQVAAQVHATDCESDKVAVTPAASPRRHPPVTQAAAVAILRNAGLTCTTRTIRNWEKGIGTPRDWPGLNDLTAIRSFAGTHATRKGLNQALKKTVRVGDIDKLPNRAVRR